MTAALSVLPYSSQWRSLYSAKRYLEHEPVDRLVQRYQDLLRNILSFGPDGRPRFIGSNEDTGWTRRIADLFAETELRGLGPQWRESVEEQILSEPYPRVLRALEAWGDRNPQSGTFLVKYGRRAHLVELVERGVLRVSLASTYADSSLNPAIRDDETTFSVHFPPGTRLRVQMGTGTYEDVSGIHGLLTHTNQCEDYYVFCASSVFDPRAFDNFDSRYDACVLIHDWEALVNLIKSHPAPAKQISAGSTVYLDPFMPHRVADIAFTKHLRYAYQQEWRLIWQEPLMNPPTPHFFFELGDLNSVCELISL